MKGSKIQKLAKLLPKVLAKSFLEFVRENPDIELKRLYYHFLDQEGYTENIAFDTFLVEISPEEKEIFNAKQYDVAIIRYFPYEKFPHVEFVSWDEFDEWIKIVRFPEVIRQIIQKD
jgi:hypothetical protein